MTANKQLSFINLPIGLSGLLHNSSQLSENFTISLDQDIEATVIEVDIELRRISLGLSINVEK